MSRRTRLVAQATRPAKAEVVVVKAEPVVLSAAIGLAGGDWRRIRVQWDGSVVVLNS